MSGQTRTGLREEVRSKYAAAARAVLEPAASVAASCCESPAGGSCCGAGSAAAEAVGGFSASLYREGETEGLPEEAVLASLGCGNPIAVADLHEGEHVLDLGSGGGIDVLLSARRVGPTGFAYGVDMTDEMLTLARANAAKAGAENVEFRKGEIEKLPLPDASVDVVISNCVINLSTDKPAVLAEMFRVLVPGGRIGITDVVAEDHMSAADRAAAGSYAGCIAGALSRAEYLDGLAAAGFTDASVTLTNEAAPGMHLAIIRAVKPALADRAGGSGAPELRPRSHLVSEVGSRWEKPRRRISRRRLPQTGSGGRGLAVSQDGSAHGSVFCSGVLPPASSRSPMRLLTCADGRLWRPRLRECIAGGQGVAGSNPAVPTQVIPGSEFTGPLSWRDGSARALPSPLRSPHTSRVASRRVNNHRGAAAVRLAPIAGSERLRAVRPLRWPRTDHPGWASSG
jgi:arsenite methyltransferase